MSRVPNIPPKRADNLLEEISQIINPATPEAHQARADFIRYELARIGNEIDRQAKKP